MLKNLSVMGRSEKLTEAQSQKMYAVVSVRPADLVTDQGVYVGFLMIDSTTDDYARARADLRHADLGAPGVSAFIVRIQDSAVIL